MKKSLIIGLTAFALLSSTVAFAKGFGCNEDKREHFKYKKQDRSKQLLRTILKVEDLSNEQVGAIYREIEEIREAKRTARRVGLRQHKDALVSSISEKGFDSKVFIEKRVSASTVKANFEAESLNSIFSILTPKQRLEVKALIESEKSRRGGNGQKRQQCRED